MSAITSFGHRLSRLRRASGLTADALASRLGVNRRTLVSWEADDNAPSVKVLETIRDIPLDWQYLVSGVSTKRLAGEQIDWELIIKINEELDAISAERGQPLSSADRIAMLRMAYATLVENEVVPIQRHVRDLQRLRA